MREAGVVIDKNGNPIHWHLPGDRSVVALPDSRSLWDILWENRETVAGFAHSHPGSGIPGPSYTDVTTFSAIEAAMGRRLDWWIASSNVVVLVRWLGPSPLTYGQFGTVLNPEPKWITELRRLSEGKEIGS